MILFEISREAFLPFLVFSFLSGIALGAIYDILRIRRMATRRAGKRRLDFVLTFFEDIVFLLDCDENRANSIISDLKIETDIASTWFQNI